MVVVRQILTVVVEHLTVKVGPRYGMALVEVQVYYQLEERAWSLQVVQVSMNCLEVEVSNHPMELEV